MANTFYQSFVDSDPVHGVFNKKLLRSTTLSGQIIHTVPGPITDQMVISFYTEPDVPYVTDIPAGEYRVVLDVSSAPAGISHTIRFDIVDPTGALIETIGTSSSQTGTGIKTHTINAGAKTLSLTSRIAARVLVSNSGADQDFAIYVGQTNTIFEFPLVHVTDSGVPFTLTVTPVVTTVPTPPPTSVPHDGIDEVIWLVQVSGTPATGLTFTDKRVLSKLYQRIEWDYHRTGGCGKFRLLLRDSFAELEEAVENGWEIHVRIRQDTNTNRVTDPLDVTNLQNNTGYQTWYRGVIRSVTYGQQGSERLVDVQGWGYVEQLNKIFIQKQYNAGLQVKDIVTDILERFAVPYSRIIRPNAVFDPTNLGIDPSTYAIKGNLHFECSALRALKMLAELQGGIEFGVDAARQFYWRQETNTIGRNFYLDKEGVRSRSGGRANSIINQIKVEGKHEGSREHLTIRGDITDITNRGLFEIASETPWLTHLQDSSRWADNVITERKGRRDWRVLEWQNIDRRIESQHPLQKIKYTAVFDDVTNLSFATYAINKIHYIKGGFSHRGEIREIGQPRQQPHLDQPVLRAEVYLGAIPRDLIEEIEAINDQLENLKSKNKQIRYPQDATNLLDVSGRIPGELKHFRPVDITRDADIIVRDVTNYDVTNNPSELQDITNPRGVLLSWLAKQWTKISTRRTFHSLPTRGLFIGEIISLITDTTNNQFGDAYLWDGNSWEKVVIGTAATLTNDPPTTITPDDVAAPGTGTTAARSDHKHAIVGDVAVDITNANVEGISTSFSRADHRHRGITTIRRQGDNDLFGGIDITNDSTIQIDRNGNILTLKAASSVVINEAAPTLKILKYERFM